MAEENGVRDPSLNGGARDRSSITWSLGDQPRSLGPWSLGEAEERRHLKYARRVVIKVGTPVVTHADGGIAIGRISAIVEQIVQLVKKGKEVVLVTSGAIGHGILRLQGQAMLSSSLRSHLSGEAVSTEYIDLKAAAAVGQSGLMYMYDMLFREYNMTCAQILVTEEDWSDVSALSQLRHTTAELLSIGAIPIVNENDAISMRTLPVIGSGNRVEWDNDEIASLLASALHADVLLILADFDRLHALGSSGKAEPLVKYSPLAELVHDCDASGAAVGEAGRPPYESRIARGGLDMMVEAASQATTHGVRTAIILSGLDHGNIARVLNGEDVGTIFLAE